MKFPEKIEQQVTRYEKDMKTADDNEKLRLEGRIFGLRAALMYFHSRDSWGNVMHPPGRLATSNHLD